MNTISFAFVAGFCLGAAVVMGCVDYKEYQKITLPSLVVLVFGIVLLVALKMQ